MQFAQDLLPWKVVDIGLRPYPDYWPFNPSIHFDGEAWRCVIRNSDYAMPDGVTIRSNKARPVGNQTKNAMVIFDPQSWQPMQIFRMEELDSVPRIPSASVGYEDMRLFRTARGGLQGIAASLHLERNQAGVAGGARHQPPEQVVLSFDAAYNVIQAAPIRGPRWNGVPQKNWVPFDGCVEPRFLYAIERGVLLGPQGDLPQGDALVRAVGVEELSVVTMPPAPVVAAPVVPAALPAPSLPPPRRGGRIAADTLLSRPAVARYAGLRGQPATRVGVGRALPVKYAGLRGGSQLVRIGGDTWLGIGHEMQFLNSRKYYWHTWYTVNGRGGLLAKSPPMKLVSNGIEFAAGLAVDGDRAVVSFGVDDMHALLGETSLEAVTGLLQPAL